MKAQAVDVSHSLISHEQFDAQNICVLTMYSKTASIWAILHCILYLVFFNKKLTHYVKFGVTWCTRSDSISDFKIFKDYFCYRNRLTENFLVKFTARSILRSRKDHLTTVVQCIILFL